MDAETHRLDLRIAVPPADRPHDPVECRPVVDGRDLLGRVPFDSRAAEPERLLGPDGLLHAAEEPREVRLAESECGAECCGAVDVTIRREGSQVCWGDWRNPAGGTLALPELCFDAGQYAAEVDRAGADHAWEWPARTTARLLAARLRERTDWQAAHTCELQAVVSGTWARDQVLVLLVHPNLAAVGGDLPWLQFKQSFPVTDQDPAVRAAALEALLTADDPRETFEVCGGTREFAEELGYPWPGPRRAARPSAS
ncbi:hypothetical protein [Kitasatospora sp. NPDC088134]|uniref:hypothetical protein n=1 Tax=Kitasatospora sp. NPDC088134 TaxID=3364071 RepID=UPI003815DB3A